MREKVYISLPISGRSIGEAREHADRVKMALPRQGYEAVSPLDVYAGEKPTYEDYICCDLREMLNCDAVIFCTGWEHSCGCGVEHYVAMRFKAYGRKGLRVMYE